jgi:hypothetical protein
MEWREMNGLRKEGKVKMRCECVEVISRGLMEVGHVKMLDGVLWFLKVEKLGTGRLSEG